MNKQNRFILKMAVDLSMMILLPLLMARSLIGETVHEWLGTVMAALFIIHHILNYKWFPGLFKGRYSGVRILGTVTNVLLLADMIALPVSGILMSRHVFAFGNYAVGMSAARIVHLLASYWGLVLISFHIGVHGGIRGKAADRKAASAVRTFILRIAAALLGLWGVSAFCRRQIGSYLFLRNQFVFYDFSQPLAYFLVDSVAVMVLFAMVGCYAVKGLKRHRSKNRPKRGGMMMLSLTLIPLILLSACGSPPTPSPAETEPPAQVRPVQTEKEERASDITPGPAELLYQGQASMRIETSEGKVIYIDPYVGEGYDAAADLILVTHSHYDHNGVERIENRNPDCQIITWKEAIQNGEYQIFDLDYVTVETVEAGYNRWHDMGECVGYVLTFSNGCSVYVTGDTSATEQMPKMAEMEIDYAFYCCDGVFNMGLEEAAECAKLVGAKHNIPYHVTARNDVFFDRTLAEQFDVENRLILDIGETLLVE